MDTVIFDIDGTLADCDHRLGLIASKPKNYKAFYGAVIHDAPITPMINVAKSIVAAGLFRTIFCSGRPEKTRAHTELWLKAHIDPGLDVKLFMRKDNDFRKDFIIKAELLNEIRELGYNPVLVFDDRPSVCKMWADSGILVARVGEKEPF